MPTRTLSLLCGLPLLWCLSGCASDATPNDPPQLIQPTRPISVGLAPGMQVKVVKDSADERVYAV